MTAQVRSELLKLRTTRTTGVLLLVAAGMTLLGVAMEGVPSNVVKLGEETTQRTIFGANVTAVLLATIAGIIVVTSEFRYGTIEPTLLFEPHRHVVMAAKLAVGALTGALFALVCTAASFGAGAAFLAVRDVHFAVSGGHVAQLVVGTIVASALAGMIGVALGALVRNQVTVIVAVLAYVVAIDAPLFAAAPKIGRFLPGKASDALGGQAVDDLLAPGVGGVIYALWTVAFVVAALVWTERADVERR
jgi:ABC-type transport system involved in multi-copper enzyme maturation permease subunit